MLPDKFSSPVRLLLLFFFFCGGGLPPFPRGLNGGWQRPEGGGGQKKGRKGVREK